MIINIRGTSGSGKSTIARQVMGLYSGERIAYRRANRQQPIGYLCTREKGKPLAVIGHYETACGGTDTINGYKQIFQLIRGAHKRGFDVLYEGLLLSGDVKWTGGLHTGNDPSTPGVRVKPLPLVVVSLNVPLDVCLASVNARRREKNGPDAPPVKPDNTIAKHRGLKLSSERLEKLGVDVRWATREMALDVIRKELRI